MRCQGRRVRWCHRSRADREGIMNELSWRKSSFSPDAGNCVYIATPADGTVKLRESDDPDVILTMSPVTLRTFIRAAKSGDFDYLGRS
ncbi:DUF397 domain-containing protein [Streptomyces sp. B1866]|uniref:DUF397 domain-containing protein n=1 Tax=Streptomyces sp. B1866 TaxID=3075431 RepID=UPI00288E795E|nr:DUF397 domain-containing protein [Streptomyces sp. B1866]MDT3395551.1 DUF397 domain-containing protein [Streptomyces sp. B1866]